MILRPFIKSVGTEIPTHTLVLLAISDVFVNYWYLIFAAPFVIYFSIKSLIKVSPGFEYALDSLKLKMWLFGPLMLKVRLARFANYFAMMYASGSTV